MRRSLVRTSWNTVVEAVSFLVEAMFTASRRDEQSILVASVVTGFEAGTFVVVARPA